MTTCPLKQKKSYWSAWVKSTSQAGAMRNDSPQWHMLSVTDTIGTATAVAIYDAWSI